MISLAIAGVAHIHIPSYLGALKERADVRVTGIWDHDETRARKRASELNVPALRDLDAIVADPGVDAVLICSETNMHNKVACPLARAKKHLFVEKPLGLDWSDSAEIAREIEKAGVIFQTGFGKRGYGYSQFLRQQVRAGNFGKVTRVRASCVHGGALRDKFDTEWRWMADPAQAGGGGFFDLGLHGLDWLIWMMGEVEDVTASIHQAGGRYPGCDEFGEGLLRFRNGVVGSLAAGWVDVTDPIDFSIWGTEGQAYVTRDDKLFFRSARVQGADGKTPWTAELPPVLPSPFQCFLDAVIGNRKGKLISVREAAYVDAVMSALYQGSKMRTWVAPQSQL